MRLQSYWEEIEADQLWRESELRFLNNHLRSAESEAERDQFRRALVLFLYAHFEGFCKFCLSVYIRAVNETGISCREANYALAAVTLSDIFAALTNPNRKSAEFRHALPDDAKLHAFARQREFVERLRNFEDRTLHVPEEVVELESNLKPVVLRKNLYRLGFPHNALEEVEGDLHQLIRARNRIAHGAQRAGVERGEYQRLFTAVARTSSHLKRTVMEALTSGHYRRAS